MGGGTLTQRILAALDGAGSYDLSGYRAGTLRRCVFARAAEVCDGDVDAYVERVRVDSDEREMLFDAITVSYSELFRDPAVFELLARDVLPAIIERRRAAGQRELRVWSAGCAAGEEPFSLAILLDQVLGAERDEWSLLIFASDVNEAALTRAKKVCYVREQLANVKVGLLDNYFEQTAAGFRIRSDIRHMVRFSSGDLTSPERAIPADSIFGSFDLVLCRNVLIYFGEAAQRGASETLARAVAASGYLILGSSERLNPSLEGRFSVVDPKSRIYRKSPHRTQPQHRKSQDL